MSQNGDTSACGCGHTAPLMPEVTFSTFILSLCSTCMVHLGEVNNPSTDQPDENLQMAKHTIDVLAMLQDKTTNCLDEQEKRLLADILAELRLKYVAKVK